MIAIATAPITIAAGMKMAMPEIQRRARAAPNAAHSRRRLAKASSKQTGRIMATPNISANAASRPAASVVLLVGQLPGHQPFEHEQQHEQGHAEEHRTPPANGLTVGDHPGIVATWPGPDH